MPTYIMNTVNILVKILVVLWWITVGWVYISALLDQMFKNYYLQKEKHYKRLMTEDPDAFKEYVRHTGILQ
jgi:D-alanyl-lipoteichoic acid acyltransferase DltB (MBOAT superfamily)